MQNDIWTAAWTVDWWDGWGDVGWWRTLSVVLTAQNRGCAGCPNCLCSWPGWARAGPAATEPSWSTLGSFSSLISPSSFPLCAEALSSSSPPSSSNSPNLAVLTPLLCLPSFSRGAPQIRKNPSLPTFSASFFPSGSPLSLYLCVCVSLAVSSSASGGLPGHLSCRGKRASCQRLKTERRRKKQQKQVQSRSPVVVQEEEEKVQEEEEGDPCKGGTFGIQFEMCSPLICSGH